MEPTITFRRSLVKRKGFFSVSIPPQLAETLGDAEKVKLSISGNGILIEPAHE